MLRSCAGLGEHGDDIEQALAHLFDKGVAREPALRVPADLSGDVDLPAACRDSVCIAPRQRPALRLQNIVNHDALVPLAVLSNSRPMISFCTSDAPS